VPGQGCRPSTVLAGAPSWCASVDVLSSDICEERGKRDDAKPISTKNVVSFILVETIRKVKTLRPVVIEPPQNEGFVDQDHLERFSTKREHNQHTISIPYHILSLSKIITH
jgi:hypothetical protein